MKQQNRELGQLGEEMAAEALRQKGYEILKKNFANRFGEIDLIVKDNDTLVFVEVKTKKGTFFGLPEEMITPGKLAKIRHMAAIYLKSQSCLCRIDVVAIVLHPDDTIARLTHYQNVY